MPQVESTVINGSRIPDATPLPSVLVLELLIFCVCVCVYVWIFPQHRPRRPPVSSQQYFAGFAATFLDSICIFVFVFISIFVTFPYCIFIFVFVFVFIFVTFLYCIFIFVFDAKTKVHRPQFLLAGQLPALQHSFSVKQTKHIAMH